MSEQSTGTRPVETSAPARRPAPHVGAVVLVAMALAAAAAVTPVGAAGQEAPGPWRAWVSYEHQIVDSELPQWTDWQAWNVAAQRSQGWGSWSVQWLRTRRFDRTDDAGVLDAYVSLPAGWYANTRVQYAPAARVLPLGDLRAELFAAVGDGWEPALAYRLFVFPVLLSPGGSESRPDNLGVLGLGLGRYEPDWYLRARADIADPLADGSTFVTLSVRRYTTGVEGFVEAVAGSGREVVEVAPGPAVETRASRALSLRTELFPWPAVGLSAVAGYNTLDDLPTRYLLALGVLTRW